ncbi:MAG TPA: Hpt domain-containing protein [Rheinheimera sp.]|uniref:Hpt domain-containing protein n=1 Tax=Rheinheimera sp. TaxID=1869214 RepID=UPI002F93A6AB
MPKISELPVLVLAVLTDMYGDDSNDTVVLALNGFNQEAQCYITQLQRAFSHADWAEAAKLAHSVKSMAGLCGAIQLSALCQQIETAARQQDSEQLNALQRQLAPCWQALLQQSQAELIKRSADDG